MKTALQLILAISSIGAVRSGILTNLELISHSCSLCRVIDRSDMILGCPPCVYALGAYALVAVVALLDLSGKR